MPEQSDPETGSGVRVMTPDEEDARTIARAMASSTAGGILRCFQGQERTASDIGTALNLPIPTIMYHLDALLDAGLVEVSRIKYSVKGREVKMYRQSDQIFVVAPQKADIRGTLLKYASLFGITAFGAGMVTLLTGIWVNESFQAQSMLGGAEEKSLGAAAAGNSAQVLSDAISRSYEVMPAAPAQVPSPGTGWIPDIAIGILIGGCLVIAMLIIFDLLSRKKKYR